MSAARVSIQDIDEKDRSAAFTSFTSLVLDNKFLAERALHKDIGFVRYPILILGGSLKVHRLWNILWKYPKFFLLAQWLYSTLCRRSSYLVQCFLPVS